MATKPAVAKTIVASTPAAEPPSQQDIANRAYQLFLERGGIHGDDLTDWLQAERELALAHSLKS